MHQVGDDFGLVSFGTLSVKDPRALAKTAASCDRAVGYVPTSDSEAAVAAGTGVSAAALLDDDDDDDDDEFDFDLDDDEFGDRDDDDGRS